MNEALFQTLFTKWLKANATKSGAYELKFTKGKTLPFSKIPEHQVTSLRKAAYGALVHKISDSAIGFKPLDCMVVSHGEAWLAVMFDKPGRRRYCYLLDVVAVEMFFKIPKKRSITEQDCLTNGIKVLL